MSRLAPVAAPPVSRTAAAKDNSAGFRPDIQGLRAIAVTVVVLYHLFPSHLPGGFVGVDVFFVISGYLITGHLWRGYRGTGKISLVDFWGRRARRLIPAAALVLAVTWIGVRLFASASEYATDAQQILASALYFQNWQLAHNAVDYLQSAAGASPVQHFWSLSVEEQFYLVWPLLFLLAALASARARRWAVAGLTIALVAGSLAYSVWDTQQGTPAAYFVTTTRMWELGIGGLLALAPDRTGRVLGRQGWLAWAGLAAIAVSLFAFGGTSAFPGYIALLPVLGAAAVIAGGSAEGRYGPYRLMSLPPMVFVGGISYSLYLWHFPVISLFTDARGKEPGLVSGAALIAVSVIVAWLSKKFVEDPVRLASWLRGHSWRSVSVALAAAVPVVLVAVFIAGEPPPPSNSPLPATGYPGAAAAAAAAGGTTLAVPREPVRPAPAKAAQPDYWLKDNCLDSAYTAKPDQCTFGDTKDPKMTVALVGDSIGGNWWAPLNAIANQEHWKLVTDLHGDCPFGPVLTPSPAGSSATFWQCPAWSKTVLHNLVTTIRPQLVLVDDEQKPAAGHTASAQSYALVGAGEASYWKQLRAHGISVAGIRETPHLAQGAATCVQQYGATAPQCQTPLSAAVPADPPSVTAARLSGAPLIDMNDLLCPKGECQSVIGNVLVYFDSHHVTQQFGTTLAPYLEQRLLATGAVPKAGTAPSGG